MADLEVSVVIPTFNRRLRLRRVLEALSTQDVAPERFEVVVVDDGSTDGTAEFISAAQYPFSLRVQRQQNGGPARARNAGIQAAQAPLILFLDDDVVPVPELVGEHLRSQAAEPRVVVMGPLASLETYAQPWVAWEQEKLEKQYTAMLHGDWEPTFRQFWTGNASLPRADVLELGGFNTEFLRAEDVELGYRLHLRGFKFRFNNKARGLHHAERSLESWCNAHHSYGRLEVDILGREGEARLVEVLSENWSRLHPATRTLIKSCLGKPARETAARLLLKQWLTLGAAANKPFLASFVCSALANLLYWQASVEELGPERAAQVFQRGDALRSGRRGAST